MQRDFTEWGPTLQRGMRAGCYIIGGERFPKEDRVVSHQTSERLRGISHFKKATCSGNQSAHLGWWGVTSQTESDSPKNARSSPILSPSSATDRLYRPASRGPPICPWERLSSHTKVYSVVYASGWVSLEHLCISRNPSHPESINSHTGWNRGLERFHQKRG